MRLSLPWLPALRPVLNAHEPTETIDVGPARKLLSGDGLGRVAIWSVESAKPIKTWQLPGWNWQVAASPDGKMIATGNGDGTVYLMRSPK